MATKYRHGAIRGGILSGREGVLASRRKRTMRGSKRRAEQGHAAGMALRFHRAEIRFAAFRTLTDDACIERIAGWIAGVR